MPTPANYYVGPNPFGLDRPPQWWLHELHLFDPQLVVVPSQRQPTFLLARKATRSGGEPLHDVRGLTQNPDTVFLNRHRLVRVCEILPGVIWDQRVFRRLAAHDIQRLGGASQVAYRLEAMDATRQRTIQRAQEDEIAARSHAAYRGYKYRIGERMSLANPHGRGSLRRQPVSVHVQTPPTRSGPLVVAP